MSAAARIDGLVCETILGGRVTGDGRYKVCFDRTQATLDQIESIHWDKPDVVYPEKYNDTKLPAGYGFEVVNISYASCSKRYTVDLKVGEQHLGDVAGFRAALEGMRTEFSKATQELTNLKELVAQQDEALIELYEKMLEGEANG